MNFAPQNQKLPCHLKSKRAIVITGATTNKLSKPLGLAQRYFGRFASFSQNIGSSTVITSASITRLGSTSAARNLGGKSDFPKKAIRDVSNFSAIYSVFLFGYPLYLMLLPSVIALSNASLLAGISLLPSRINQNAVMGAVRLAIGYQNAIRYCSVINIVIVFVRVKAELTRSGLFGQSRPLHSLLYNPVSVLLRCGHQ
jgi:hypothetical protein